MPPRTRKSVAAKLRASSKKYYNKNGDDGNPQAWHVQLKRLFKRIKQTGRMPRKSTLDKYHIEVKDGQIVFPDELAVRNEKVTFVDPPQATELNYTMTAPVQAPTILQEGTITPESSYEYLRRHYTVKGQAFDTFSKSWQYVLGRKLFSLLKGALGIEHPETCDFVKALNQYKTILDYINGMTNKGKPVVESTKESYLKSFGVHVTQNPALRAQITPEALAAFGDSSREAAGARALKGTKKLKEEPVYRWDQVIDKISSKFPRDSLQNMFFRVYNEAPTRNDLHELKVVTVAPRVIERKANYCVIPEHGDIVRIHIAASKTIDGSVAYPEISYFLTPETSAIVKANFAARREADRHVLIPVNGSMWIWAHEALVKAGIPLYPYGKKSTNPGQDTMNGSRHAIATFRNSPENSDLPKGVELAKLMQHSIGTMQQNYLHERMIDVPGQTA